MATYFGEHEASERNTANRWLEVLAFASGSLASMLLFVAIFSANAVAFAGAVLFVSVATASQMLSKSPADDDLPASPTLIGFASAVVALGATLVTSPAAAVIAQLTVAAGVLVGARYCEALLLAAREDAMTQDHERLISAARTRAAVLARRTARERERPLIADSEVRLRDDVSREDDLAQTLDEDAVRGAAVANDIDADGHGRVA